MSASWRGCPALGQKKGTPRNSFNDEEFPDLLAGRRTVSELQSAPHPKPDRGNMFTIASQSVSDADFALFQRLIEKATGIYLSTAKKNLLVGRLSCRMRELGLTSLHKYYKRVIADPDEFTCMVDYISTNETQFFREPPHFDFLERHVLPCWAAQASAG